MAFQCGNFISSGGIVNDETAIFSSNGDLISLDFDTAQNNVRELDGFEISLVRKFNFFTPLGIGRLFSAAYHANLSGDVFSKTSRDLAAMNFPNYRFLFVNTIKYGLLILVEQILRVPYVFELLFISES
jgi:hypothetical protein